ncbi:MAG: radical SAM family heme chaperone HemW [Clostridia bacterium]|nr:radical SAM family heme chaperone HemW [Clostridia bacterium]
MSLGIYVHVPFCRSKCPYCDFYSVVNRDEDIKEKFTERLIREIREGSELPWFLRTKPDTLYFGGGTPALLSTSQLERITGTVKDIFGGEELKEVTIEVNPGSTDLQKLKELRSIGFNRLSVGVQSFDDEILRKLGRLHKSQDSFRVMEDAGKAGFENVSIDLMFGIDGQSFETWETSLHTAIDLRPEHLSLYSLEFQEGTVFTRLLREGRMKETDPEEDRRMYETAHDELERAGYEHYEISNFAEPGCRSMHNMKYWSLQEYLGLGPGAHSYLRREDNGLGQRFYNRPDLKAYLDGTDIRVMSEPNDISDDASEFMITALRLTEGVSKEEFRDLFGVGVWDFFGDVARLQFQSFVQTGHALEDEDRITLTLQGFNVSNRILSIFV